MEEIQLAQLVDHSNPDAILAEVRKTYLASYSEATFWRIEHAFGLILLLFSGKYPGYLACNTEYHDLYHTLDAFLAASRLMDGKNISEDRFDEPAAMRLLLAALFHDTGYIQEESDSRGTGAKYTMNHEERSIEFVRRNGSEFSLSAGDIEDICVLIACTELMIVWDEIPFTSDDQMKAGALLATADLLGQMSDRKYLEKLLFLYYEFREAGIAGFNTEFDILRKTLDFYERTRNRLDTTLQATYRYAQIHFSSRYSSDSNLYMDSIERQMNYLETIIADETMNFRNKLKRIDLNNIEPRYSA
jgi:hypothetical protein